MCESSNFLKMQILTQAWRGARDPTFLGTYKLLGDTASSGTHILSSDRVHPEEGGVGLPGSTLTFERGQPKKTPSSLGERNRKHMTPETKVKKVFQEGSDLSSVCQVR